MRLAPLKRYLKIDILKGLVLLDLNPSELDLMYLWHVARQTIYCVFH